MKNFLVTFMLLIFATNSTAFAALGNSSGGGGDVSESRVDEIRADILKWILAGGGKNLKISEPLTYEEYFTEMVSILKPHKVVISFTTDKVLVRNTEKTCKGHIADSGRPNILCNIARFNATDEAAQYSLIHHEFAGLARVESNQGASSDYNISNQLTGFLEHTQVLKLVVKEKSDEDAIINSDFKHEIIKNVRICAAECTSEIFGHRGHDLAQVGIIHYAPSVGPWYAEGECLENSKTITVYSDRMTNSSMKTCTDALSGKFWGDESVTIDNKKESEDGWYFSIVKDKSKKDKK